MGFVLVMVGVNAARHEWDLAIEGLILATGILLAMLPYIEDC